MKKIVLAAFLAVFGFALATRAFAQTTPVGGRRIVIDAGHGGADYGSTECAGYPEKEATLDIAYRLKDLLQANGAIAGMTRTNDSDKSNKDRYTFANSFGGEALVSIHLNGSTDHSVNGTQGLYGKPRKDKAFAEALHNRLASELGVADLGATNFASGVLLKTKMPASIQEAVFISNTDECARLTDGVGARQQQIAESLYNGLADWFSQ